MCNSERHDPLLLSLFLVKGASKYRLHSSGQRALHTWYRLQRCVVHRGIKNVVREPSWWPLACHVTLRPGMNTALCFRA